MSSRPSSRNTNLRTDTLSPRSPSSERKSPISGRSPLSAARLPNRSRTPDNLTVPSDTGRPSSISTTNLVVAANQLLQINAPPPQRLRAAHELLALSEEDASPMVLQTVYQLLSSMSGSEQTEFKASESPRVSLTLPPNRINLHQHRNLPYFSLKPAGPESLPSIKLKERPIPPPVSQELPSSIPRIQTRSKTWGLKQTQARLTRPGAVVGSRMASLHHPTAEVPRFISKQSSQNLTLDSSFATSNYIYTLIWTDPNTGEEVNISTSQVVNLQILIQTATSDTNGTSNSFQFSIPVGSTSNPSVLLNGSPNTPTTNLSGWNVVAPTNSSPFSITVTNSAGTALGSGTLLIVYVNAATINSSGGVSLISITEQNGTTTNASIIKSPSYLILKDMYFTTTNNGSGTPVTAVTPGTSIYVSWIMYNPTATSASVVLYWNDSFSGSSQTANVGIQGSGFTTYPTAITVNSDTVFTLTAQTPSGKTYQIQQAIKVTQVGLIAPQVTIGQGAQTNLNIYPTNWGGSNLGSTAVINMGDANHNITSTFGAGLSINDTNAIALNSGTVNINGNTTLTNLAVTGTTTIASNLTVNGIFNLLPMGVILAFNGTNIPPGWLLCNGQNGTPDLRGRFILGSGGTYQVGVPVNGSTSTSGTMNWKDTGGEQLHQLSVLEMPSHTHPYNAVTFTGGYIDDTSSNWNSAGSGTTGATGGNGSHNTMPPFYVLTYIMKQ